jgi:hypothetical protein
MSDGPKRIGTTGRGFGVYATFTDAYDALVSVHQSSSAERDAVWITTDGGGITGNKGAMHLEAEHARQVRDGLTTWLIEMGEE